MRNPALVTATLLLLAGCSGATDVGGDASATVAPPPTRSGSSSDRTGPTAASATASTAPPASTGSRTPTSSPTPTRSRLGAEAPVPSAARRSGFLRALDLYAPDLRDEQSDARLVRVGAGLCLAWDAHVALSRTNTLLDDEGYSQDESGALVAAAVTAICPQHEELVSE